MSEKNITKGDQHKIMVTLPIAETPEQRKLRAKELKPLPHFSFMVSGNAYGVPPKRN